MKKYVRTIGITLTLVVVCLILISQYKQIYYRAVTSFGFPNFHKVVIIDAGHGGVDPGKVGSQGAHEKDLNKDRPKASILHRRKRWSCYSHKV